MTCTGNISEAGPDTRRNDALSGPLPTGNTTGNIHEARRESRNSGPEVYLALSLNRRASNSRPDTGINLPACIPELPLLDVDLVGQRIGPDQKHCPFRSVSYLGEPSA